MNLSLQPRFLDSLAPRISGVLKSGSLGSGKIGPDSVAKPPHDIAHLRVPDPDVDPRTPGQSRKPEGPEAPGFRVKP